MVKQASHWQSFQMTLEAKYVKNEWLPLEMINSSFLARLVDKFQQKMFYYSPMFKTFLYEFVNNENKFWLTLTCTTNLGFSEMRYEKMLMG